MSLGRLSLRHPVKLEEINLRRDFTGVHRNDYGIIVLSLQFGSHVLCGC